VPEVPEVSVRDPAHPAGRSELLRDEDTRRRVPRPVAVGAAVVLVAAAGAAASVDVRQERAAEQRREARAAAELARDTVHLSAHVERISYAADSAGWLQALVRVDDDGTVGYADRVVGMRLSGAALVPQRSAGSLAAVRGGDRVLLSAALDCREVARGRLPRTPAVTVTVVTAAGRPHDLLVPIRAPDLRGQALAACGLPDPLQR
jgi:hypothetical protein